ncbi:helix-turn-helix domain-containing protein [Pseudonocardia sp. RS010]|uniref:helix-turn-helix domain-containing protein n=1 Tax=Pseudonocardia sp. RS010 TaxID=3385979 RepID=UPI00399F7E6A
MSSAPEEQVPPPPTPLGRPRIAPVQGAPPAPGEGDRVRGVGRIVHDLRRDQMTLAELSTRAGVSMGLLSRLENGSGNPSFRVLSRIAHALGVHVSTLFAEARPPTTRLVRAEERLRVVLPDGRTEYEVIVPDLSGRLCAHLWRFPRGYSGEGAAQSREGVQFIYVLRGRLELHIDHEVHALDTGDAVTFDALRRHWIRNSSARSAAEALVVTSPPFLPGGAAADR